MLWDTRKIACLPVLPVRFTDRVEESKIVDRSGFIWLGRSVVMNAGRIMKLASLLLRAFGRDDFYVCTHTWRLYKCRE